MKDKAPNDRYSWSKVDALFDAALDRPEDERADWLHRACAGDARLKAEVERLLALCNSEDERLRPSGAMKGPLWEEVAGELERGVEAYAFEVGDLAGAYEILGVLGTGGMGQVYTARDQKLGRKVALKVLPPGMDSAEYRRRFDREAKAIAALNHPNIVHLYSMEEAEGVHFITMELVQGKTLGEVIPEKGFVLDRFFDIAVHLVDALVAAHESGVIHRDLKPANIMVSDEGRVKILDFGLAKLRPGDFFQDEHSTSATVEGHIVGTASHMSPEQAEGKELDPRTDLFSLGVVLYEMCTGQMPFRGESAAAILTAIMKETPPTVTEINPGMPGELSRIIKRCLAKDRQRRYQTALDVRNDLEDLRYELTSGKLFETTTTRQSGSRLGFVSVVAAAVIAVATIGFVVSHWGPRESRPASGTFSRLTSQPGQEMFPSLSPDGRFVTYAAPSSSSWDIYLLRVGGRRSINLTEDSTEDDTQPVFSADGERIAFRSARDGGGIFVMGATGEFVQRVTTFGWNPSWSPDGQQIVFATEAISRTPADRPTTSQLWVASVESGETRILTEGDGVQPSWSPHGHRIAYWSVTEDGAQRDIWTIPSEGGEPRTVTEDRAVDWTPVWSPDGRYLYFASDRGGSMNVWRIPIDEESGDVEGEPEPVTTPSAFASHLSFSQDGAVMAYTSTSVSFLLRSVDFDPNTSTVAERLDTDAPEVRGVGSADPSPDGEWIAFSRVAAQEDIVLVRPDGAERHPLTDDIHRDRHPRWSPDGTRIAFYSNRSGSYEIWSVNPDGGGLEQLTDTPDRNLRYPIWSPDGARMAFSNPGTSGTIFDLRKPWKDQTTVPLPPFSEEGEAFVPMDWSPDGGWLVGYIQTPSGIRSGVAVFSLESRQYETLTDFGLNPHWLGDSLRIVFQAQGSSRSREQHNYQQDYKLYVVDRQTKDFTEVFAVPGASVETPTLTADNKKIYFTLTAVDSDIWLMTYDEPR